MSDDQTQEFLNVANESFHDALEKEDWITAQTIIDDVRDIDAFAADTMRKDLNYYKKAEMEF